MLKNYHFWMLWTRVCTFHSFVNLRRHIMNITIIVINSYLVQQRHNRRYTTPRPSFLSNTIFDKYWVFSQILRNAKATEILIIVARATSSALCLFDEWIMCPQFCTMALVYRPCLYDGSLTEINYISIMPVSVPSVSLYGYWCRTVKNPQQPFHL